MSLILTTSIAIRIAALVWSLVLLRRVRDLRMALLSAMLALMALRQILTVAPSAVPWRGFVFSPQRHFEELPGLIVSVLAFLAVIGLERMLTSWRRDAEALQQRERERHQAQKMEAIGTLAGGIAHDFNNLLTVVLGHVNLMQSSLPRDAPEQEDLSAVEEAAQHASELTGRILAFARRRPIKAIPLELDASIRDLLPMLSRLLGDRIELDADLGAGSAVVVIDATQLQLVLVNLVVNARDALPDGGHIVIATRLEGRDGKGDAVVLSVRDDGVGMAEDVRQQIFEPFFTTKGVGKGTGLGLSTIYGIMQASNGTVTCTSKTGHGTTFELTLPCSGLQPVEKRASSARPSGRKATILLIEDEVAVRDMLCRALQEDGHTVTTAEDGRVALERSAAMRPPPDLVVTDLMMPGLTGWEVAKRLRADHANLPVIVLSGHAEHGSDEQRLTPPCLFLRKPVSLSELREAVFQMLDFEETAVASA